MFVDEWVLSCFSELFFSDCVVGCGDAPSCGYEFSVFLNAECSRAEHSAEFDFVDAFGVEQVDCVCCFEVGVVMCFLDFCRDARVADDVRVFECRVWSEGCVVLACVEVECWFLVQYNVHVCALGRHCDFSCDVNEFVLLFDVAGESAVDELCAILHDVVDLFV